MIVFTILGTSADSTEEQLQAITNDLVSLCKRVAGRPDVYGPTPVYVAFPIDRMRMDLGAEVIVQVASHYTHTHSQSFSDKVKKILLCYFPKGTKIGIQVIAVRLCESI